MKRYNTKKRGWCSKCNGFSLLDVVIASTVLLIVIVGTCAYRYHSTLDGRKAAMQTSAARIAEMLYESWRGVQGAATYNPTAYSSTTMTIGAATSGPDVPAGFTKLNNYTVTADNFSYSATLSWQNISAGLRVLNVAIAWPTSGSGTPDNSYTLTSYTLY
jgi:Tfp pilus assembly protein PilV